MKNNNLLKGISTVMIVGIVIAAVILIPKKTENTDTGNEVATTSTNTIPTPTNSSSTIPKNPDNPEPIIPVGAIGPIYKDGSYSATGSYQSPEGTESIGVSLVLKNDVVITSTVVGNATGGISQRYQGIFIDNYKQYVIGKEISTLSLNKVSGSSLTPIGFNNAVRTIRAKAKS